MREDHVRFMEKVAVGSDPNDCWHWLGAKTGYGKNGEQTGVVNWDGKQQRAHRVAYTIFCEPIPVGKQVYRSCTSSFCVNPAHLWVGTTQDYYRRNPRPGKLRPPTTKKPFDAEALLRDLRNRKSGTVVDLAARYGLPATTVGALRAAMRGAPRED